jgi:hypothetical protein
MNDDDKTEQYLIATPHKNDEEVVSGYLYQKDESTASSRDINIDTDYAYFTEDQLSDLKIDLFIEYSKQLLNCKFKIGKNQKESFVHVLNQLADIIPPKNFKLIFTPERELQLFREQSNANASIIIDEDGGVSLAIIGESGLGYKYDYLESEQFDEKGIYLFTKYFLGDHFC